MSVCDKCGQGDLFTCPCCDGSGQEYLATWDPLIQPGAMPIYNIVTCYLCEGAGKLRYTLVKRELPQGEEK